MNFRDFATTEFGTRLWMRLGQWLPPHTGHAVARGAATVLSQRKSSVLYQALRINQSAVRCGMIGEAELNRAVEAVLLHAGMVSYDLVRLVSKGDAAIRQAITFGPEAWRNVEAARAGGRGVMLCGPHLSAFHLGIMGFALRGLPLQFLLAAAAPGGYTLVQQMVSRHQVQATQVGAPALREALRRLSSGGMVLTGVDWPQAPGETAMLSFFGRPAYLPTGHIRLAISAQARLLPVAIRWEPGSGYRGMIAPPLDLELSGDRTADAIHNAQRVLRVVERWIAERPEQWLMYYPVWRPQDLAS